MRTFVILSVIAVAIAVAIAWAICNRYQEMSDCESKRCSAGHQAQLLPYVGCLCVEIPKR